MKIDNEKTLWTCKKYLVKSKEKNLTTDNHNTKGRFKNYATTIYFVDFDIDSSCVKNSTFMWTLFILFLSAKATELDPEQSLPTNGTLGPDFQIGSSCNENCSDILQNSFCDESTSTCKCLDTHPVSVGGLFCLQIRTLHEPCDYDEQCFFYDEASVCQKLPDEEVSVCTCKEGFYEDKEHNIPIKYRCFPDSSSTISQTTIPAIGVLLICLSILTILLCFIFNLFSRSRWARARAYADANIEPPQTIIEGPSIDIEKQFYNPEEAEPLNPTPSPNPNTIPTTSINITLASPSSSILKSGSENSRRGSGNNNTNFVSSSTGAISRRSSGNVSFGGGGVNSRRTSLQRSGLTVSGTDLKDSRPASRRGSSFTSHNTAATSSSVSRRSSSNVSLKSKGSGRKASIGLSADLIKALRDLESGEGEIEQTLTIVPNPRAKRRGSMANYAFPELHSRSVKNRKEPENLLILTRTRTDPHGRRHSVAVPLIPPPEGEKFEGGYHIERNPITGGATLVPPEGPFVRGRSSSERRRSVRTSPSPRRGSITASVKEQQAPASKQSKKDFLGVPSNSWSPCVRTQSLVPTTSKRSNLRTRSVGMAMPPIGEQEQKRSVTFSRSKSLYTQRKVDPPTTRLSQRRRTERRKIRTVYSAPGIC